MGENIKDFLAKLTEEQLKQLADEKKIDGKKATKKEDYIDILEKSKEITKEDIDKFLEKVSNIEDVEKKEEGEAEEKSPKPSKPITPKTTPTPPSPTQKPEQHPSSSPKKPPTSTPTSSPASPTSPPPSPPKVDMTEIENILKNTRNLDMMLEKPIKSLRQIQSIYEEEDYERAISEGIKARGMMDGVAERYERMRKAYAISAFKRLISDVDEAGIDVNGAEQLLNKTVAYFNADQYNEVDKALDEIIENATEFQSMRAKKVKEMIFSTETFINDAKDLNADVSEAMNLLRRAEDMYFSKNYNKAVYFSTKAKRAAEEARKHFVQGISEAMLFVKTVIDDARGIGADVSEPEDLHSKAKQAFKTEEYAKCKKLIKEAEQLALELQEAQIQKAIMLKGKKEREKPKPKFADLTKSVVEVETEPSLPDSQQKTRCPNCGQRFTVKKGPKPFQIECPYCGLRGWMH